MADDEKTRDYEVGWGKPPKDHQYKKGQSGNPKGRSKGRKNNKTIVLEELSAPIRVREGDRVRTITRFRAIVRRSVEQALKGSERAIERSSRWAERYDADDADAAAPLGADDRDILDRYVAERLAALKAADGADDDGGAGGEGSAA